MYGQRYSTKITSELSVIRSESPSVFVYLTDEPMHECHCKPNENPEWDDEVWPRRSVQLLRERPSNGVAVKRLNLLPAPDVVSHRLEKDFAL